MNCYIQFSMTALSEYSYTSTLPDIFAMNNNEFLINNATIETQPKQNFHYRYVSELAGNTHGVVSGQQDDYPKIKLLLPENGHLDDFGNKRDFFMLCSLHCYDNKVLTPHLLMAKGETELNYSFIFEQMEEVKGNPIERFWKLREYVIVRLTASNYKTSFHNKQKQYEGLALPLQFENILGQLNLNDTRRVKDSGKLNVCLGFTIFERDFYTNTYSLYRDTIFSCNIYHGDDLRINRLCNTKGSALGGTEVTILIRIESNLPLNVVVKKIDNTTKETLWSTVVEIQKHKIFGNAAITFTMPAYKGPASLEDEIEVFMYLRIGNTTYKSDNIRFYYINERSFKRPRRNDPDDYVIESGGKMLKLGTDEKYLSCDHVVMSTPPKENIRSKEFDIKAKIDDIFNNSQNFDSMVSYSSRDSIFYDALESTDALIHFYKTAIAANKQHLVAGFRNENRENLLHWACKMNYYHCIRPLIGLGCHTHEQDKMGRTPLHIALTAKYTKCIAEFRKLIEDHSLYPIEVANSFIKLVQAYNHNGYTILHETVLGEYNELFETIMIFLSKHNMNALEYEVLGSGDSIVHLVDEKNLLNMWPLIKKYVPDYKNAKNYNGKTIEDLRNDETDTDEMESDEILQNLNI